MKRTIISLPEATFDALAAHCELEGISRAEAVRRALSAYLRDVTPAPGDAAFGLWSDREFDGRNYEDGLRGEWES